MGETTALLLNEVDRRAAQLTSEKQQLEWRLAAIVDELQEIARVRAALEGFVTNPSFSPSSPNTAATSWLGLSRTAAVQRALDEADGFLTREDVQRVLWDHGRIDELASVSAALSHLKSKGKASSPSWGFWTSADKPPEPAAADDELPEKVEWDMGLATFA
jgi:hypothetical protein